MKYKIFLVFNLNNSINLNKKGLFFTAPFAHFCIVVICFFIFYEAVKYEYDIDVYTIMHGHKINGIKYLAEGLFLDVLSMYYNVIKNFGGLRIEPLIKFSYPIV